MNIDNWVPKLYSAISLIKGALFDEDLHLSIPLNKSANEILKKVDGIKTCRDIYEETKGLYKVDQNVYYKDFKKLISLLNKKGIISLDYKNHFPVVEKSGQLFLPVSRDEPQNKL